MKQRIIASFGIVVAALLVVGAISVIALQRLRHLAVNVQRDSLPGLVTGKEIEKDLYLLHALWLSKKTATEPAEVARLVTRMDAAERALDDSIRAYEKTISTTDDRAVYERVARSAAEFRQAIDSDSATETTTYERAAADAQALTALNDRNASSSATETVRVAAAAQRWILIGLMLASGVAVVAGLLLYRAIVKPLSAMAHAAEAMKQGNFGARLPADRRDELGVLSDGMNSAAVELGNLIGNIQKTGVQVSTSATEIAATAREQQATANEVAATVTEVGATAREISATAKELSRTMNEVARVAENAAVLATKGKDGIGRMQTTMQQVMHASAAVTAKLADVNERAGSISSVVTTITKVADQTNLLSLNAAIEAEKAGEYGRGFAVVASEIRRLADQTALATQDIEKTVGQMQSAVAAGVMGIEKFGDEVRGGVEVVRRVGADLESIIAEVQTLTPAFESVNEGMRGQTVAAEQITEALSQLNEAAQQAADSLRQSNVAIDQLNNVTRALQQGVSRFTFAT